MPMHELTIATSILELARRHMPAGSVLRAVHVRAGPMRSIERSAMDLAWRACVAAAFRSRSPTVAVDWLPTVPQSHGTRSVSPSTTSTDSRGTRSSSATSIAKPVRIPCPYSTFPAYAVTDPFGRTTSQVAVSCGTGPMPTGPTMLRPSSALCAASFTAPLDQ